MTKNKLTVFLSYLVLLLMLLPFLQSILNLVAERPLGGYYPKPKNPAFSTASWWTVDFQNKKEFYLKNSFGFRKPLLRLKYQMLYDLYSMSRVRGFLVGKNDYLFQDVYTNADQGYDFVGQNVIDSNMLKIKAVQRKMKAEGKHFFVVICPSKTRYHKEFLPDYYLPKPNVVTNMDEYAKRFKRDSIPFLNMNEWFLAMKDTTPYPLYPKTGIHFSTYGAALVADSMINYLENVLGKDIPDFYWDKIDYTDWLKHEARDLEWAMNLMERLPNIKMAYPEIKINEKYKYKPKVLTIGDSYFWRFYHWGGLDKVFNNSKFLYYNREIYPGKVKRSQYNLALKIKDLDAICIFINPSEFYRFSWGIVDDLYQHYYGVSDAEILNLIAKIKKDPKWLASIEKKAKILQISVDSMLHSDAQYALRIRNQNKKNKTTIKQTTQFKKQLQEVKQVIKNNPKWYAQIKEKAKKRSIPVDSMLFLDARYYLKSKAKKTTKK